MKISGQLRFIVINKQANSLYSLIADGTYRATSLGRNEWKKLIGAAGSLQQNCNREGFNIVGTSSYYSKARVFFFFFFFFFKKKKKKKKKNSCFRIIT